MQTEKKETKRLLRELGDQARVVGKQDDERRAAIKSDRDSKAELLEAVVDAVRPALRAIATRVQLDAAGTRCADRNGLLVGTKKTKEEYVVGPVVRPISGDPLRGRYGGEDLFLMEDGGFFEVTYDGPWSKVAGEKSGWQGIGVPVGAAEVVAGYDLGSILDEVEEELVAQAGGGAARATARAWASAERIHAIAVLVRAS
jgi:hypothetical protein